MGVLHCDVWRCWPSSALVPPLSGNATLFSIAMCSYNRMKRNRWHYYTAFKWVHFIARSLHQQHWAEETRALWQFCCLLGAMGHSKTCLILLYTCSRSGNKAQRGVFLPVLGAFSQAENKLWDPSILSNFWKATAFSELTLACLHTGSSVCVSVICWAEGRGFLQNTLQCRFPSLSLWISHGPVCPSVSFLAPIFWAAVLKSILLTKL